MTKALLLAMMSPPPAMEEEFNDWYDHEHYPHLSAVPGFETTARYVSEKSWPKYVALYDLESYDVFSKPQYTRAPGPRFTPWTKRILEKMHGQYRFDGDQVFPGEAKMGDGGKATTVAVLRFRGASSSHEGAMIKGLDRIKEASAEVLQVRLFRGNKEQLSDHYIALVECRAHDPKLDVAGSVFGDAANFLDLIAFYVPYWRRGFVPTLFDSK